MAEPETPQSPEARSSALRAGLRRAVTPGLFAAAIATLVVVAGIAGYVARTDEVDRLDRQLAALTAQVGNDDEVVDNATARVVALSEDNLRLAADLDSSADLNADLAARLANVEAAVQSTTDLETGLEALIAERDQLREDLGELTADFVLSADRLEDLKIVESFGPSGNPLLFDASSNAWVTQPVCTGSMEPTIGCEDLLVVYKPTITDLDVGDVIIFKRPGPACEGFVAGSFLLHRITRVLSSPTDGLMFETKGDANASLDPCRAPVSSVTGKVLAIVQNSRLPG